MKKEYKWEVDVDGVTHLVTCIPDGNRYQLWVDEEDSIIVYRESVRKMSRGLEREVEIGGKTCLFVVWDERPELVVDDVMLGSGKNFCKETAKRNKGMMVVHGIMLCLGVLLLGFVAASFLFGWLNDKWEWIDYAVYIFAGVLLVTDAGLELKHRKKH